MADRKLTMESSVRSIALKFYGEQLVNTFGTDEQKQVVDGYSTKIKEEATKLTSGTQDGINHQEQIQLLNQELTAYVESIISPIEEEFYANIKKYDKSYAQVLVIKHNRDYNTDDVWEPSVEKPHYHLIARTINNKPVKVKMLLSNPKTSKRGLVAYRKELDDVLFDKSGVQTIGDFQKYTVYLTHETEEAERDGKALYDYKTEIISNMDTDEIELIRDGYKQVSRIYVKPKDAREADKIAYELGKKLKSFEDWYGQLPFDYRKRNDMKIIKESYDRGVDEALAYATEIPRVCVFIKGAENLGKSYSSIEALKKVGIDPKYILKVTDGTGKFDNLTVNHKAIIVDDTTAPSLLHLADTKPCKVYRRNKGNGVWVGDYLIVCSNTDINTWAKHCGIADENYKAFFSRFNCIEVFADNTVEIQSYASRGTDILLQIRRKFDMFMKAFDKVFSAYKPMPVINNIITELDGNEDLYKVFKIIVTKYPIESWRLYNEDEYLIHQLPCTLADAYKLIRAMKVFYRLQPALLVKARNTYCVYPPAPSLKEKWASLYGYDTTDIDKEYEEMLYDRSEYENSINLSKA